MNEEELLKLKSSMSAYLRDENYELSQIVNSANISLEYLGEQGFGNTVSVFQIVFSVSIDAYKQFAAVKEYYQKELLDTVKIFVSNNDFDVYDVILRPQLKMYLNWDNLTSDVSPKDLLSLIVETKQMMKDVATGQSRIQDINADYQSKYTLISNVLNQLGINNPNNCTTLWDWYNVWKQTSSLSTYASRRAFIDNLYKDLISIIAEQINGDKMNCEPTGWNRVDRSIYEMKSKLNTAVNEEQFQAIALIGRETLISIAQEVFDGSIHKCDDGINPSDTDSKRMLDAYISYALQGASNERHRKFAKSAIDLASQVTHDRCATKKDATMCFIAVSAVSNLIKTLDN